MKKHLIAAAVAAAVAAPAFAQNVSIYGRIDQAYYSIKDKKPASNTESNTDVAHSLSSVNSGLDGGVGGSRLGFSGTEDLGGGLKANFVVEFGVDVGDNAGIGSTRLGFVDLSGGFGTVRVGRQVSPTKAVADAYNALGNNTNFAPGDMYGSTAPLNIDTRVSNAITYLTPNFNGFTAQFQYADAYADQRDSEDRTNFRLSSPLLNGNSSSAGTATLWNTSAVLGTQQGKVTGLGLNYASGPIAVGYGMTKQKVKSYLGAVGLSLDEEAAIVPIYDLSKPQESYEDSRWILAGSYDFGAAKLVLEHANRKTEGDSGVISDLSVNTIGVVVPLGAITLAGQLSSGESEGINGNSKTDIDGYKLRAMYSFSKRTAVYAQIGETESDKNGAKTTKEGYAIGIAHTF